MKTIIIMLLFICGWAQIATAQIQKNTIIQVSVMGVPAGEQSRINSAYPVDERGNIRMWGIGTVRASGLSPTALAKKIESAYKKAELYTDPTILIQTGKAQENLKEIITITGSVKKQGPIKYQKDMTLMEAIATAGGANTFGTTKRVNLFREGKKYLLSPLTNDRHKLEKVYPGDTIEIDQVKAWESGGE